MEAEKSKKRNPMSIIAPELYDDIELIMQFEKFVGLLFNVHLMKEQLATLIFPKYGSKDKKSITSDIFVHILKDLHEVWEANLPCDADAVLRLHQIVSPSLNPVLTLEECDKFFTNFVITQYDVIKEELIKRKLLFGDFIVARFISRPIPMLKDLLNTCEISLSDMPKLINDKFSFYFDEIDQKADKFTFRDCLRTLSNHVMCRSPDRPDRIFDTVFNSVDKDSDGKINKKELEDYIKNVIIGIKEKLLDMLGPNSK